MQGNVNLPNSAEQRVFPKNIHSKANQAGIGDDRSNGDDRKNGLPGTNILSTGGNWSLVELNKQDWHVSDILSQNSCIHSTLTVTSFQALNFTLT